MWASLLQLVGPDNCEVLTSAHALYSLTQDNDDFSAALLAVPNALPTLVTFARNDHSQAEAGLKRAAKGKGKSKDEKDDDDEIEDGRALLSRVLVSGALRNIVEPGSSADSNVGIAELSNDVIVPLVNSLLDVNLGNVVQRVTELVGQVVCLMLCYS